jgi:hypothetical protein
MIGYTAWNQNRVKVAKGCKIFVCEAFGNLESKMNGLMKLEDGVSYLANGIPLPVSQNNFRLLR